MTDRPAAGDAGSDDPETAKRRVTGLLDQAWTSLADLVSQLDDEQWEAPALPGWRVHDVVAHVIGTERQLAGDGPPPPLPPEATASHVHNDIARMNEAWIVALHDVPHHELGRQLSEITATRSAQLDAMTPDAFLAPSWTPVGPGTYGRFMEVRVFDVWMHEQDIRAATGLPGHESGPVAEQSLTEVTRSLGYIVGKRAALPDGTTVRIRLSGPLVADLFVVVDGRASVVGELPGEPSVALTLSSSLFLRLAGGRLPGDRVLDQIDVGGDPDLARQLATHLAFTL